MTKNTNGIPRARLLLEQVADGIEETHPIYATVIRDSILPSMHRSKPKRAPAPTQHPAINAVIVRGVKKMLKDNPGLSQTAVAMHFDINIGRVSEIVHGKRTVEYPGGVPTDKS